jgi:hypothetical protein
MGNRNSLAPPVICQANQAGVFLARSNPYSVEEIASAEEHRLAMTN